MKQWCNTSIFWQMDLSLLNSERLRVLLICVLIQMISREQRLNRVVLVQEYSQKILHYLFPTPQPLNKTFKDKGITDLKFNTDDILLILAYDTQLSDLIDSTTNATGKQTASKHPRIISSTMNLTTKILKNLISPSLLYDIS